MSLKIIIILILSTSMTSRRGGEGVFYHRKYRDHGSRRKFCGGGGVCRAGSLHISVDGIHG